MRWIGIMLAVILGGFSSSAESQHGQVFSMDRMQQERSGVSDGAVEERRFGDAFRVVGEVQRAPGTIETVKSLIPGRVEEVLVSPGQTVVAGDVLVMLHSHELMAAQHELQRLYDEVRLAENRLEAGERLLQVEGIAELEVEARRLTLRSARRSFAGARAELADLGMDADAIVTVLEGEADPHLALRAHTSGVVLDLRVQPHLWIEAYQSLVELGDADRVELGLQIPSDQVDRVSADDRVEFAPVGVPTAGGEARVISRVPEVDPETRTLRVRAAIRRAPPGLFPGVFIEGRLFHGEVRTALAIPRSAVIAVAGVDSVFVRRGPEEFECVAVELGRSEGAWVEVVRGVEAGERVATGGVFLLKSTMLAASVEE
jgi:cobalt-zinc-cadmium efflux system membrane fusion protein